MWLTVSTLDKTKNNTKRICDLSLCLISDGSHLPQLFWEFLFRWGVYKQASLSLSLLLSLPPSLSHTHTYKWRALENRKHIHLQVHLTICSLLDSIITQRTHRCTCTHVHVIHRSVFVHRSHANTHIFKSTHCIFVLTYYRASKHTYTCTRTAEAQTQMVFLCMCCLEICKDAGDICSTGVWRGVGGYGGGK